MNNKSLQTSKEVNLLPVCSGLDLVALTFPWGWEAVQLKLYPARKQGWQIVEITCLYLHIIVTVKKRLSMKKSVSIKQGCDI